MKKEDLKSYIEILNKNYSPKEDFIFSRAITDEDFLLECINLDSKIKNKLFYSATMRPGIRFVSFLQNHYTQNEIIELWKSINSNIIPSKIVQSTSRAFSRLRSETVSENFKKVDMNFIDLYNEFIRLKSIEKRYPIDSLEIPYKAVNNIFY
ncbi:hypothetical protein ACLHDG_00230 [Sulfurovum sp. CS9]|uniref:hypothetical protein n=1 Tax=Sulfurovum sp. CS9 TaxID=3391146 RepID=UPI0039EB5D77